MDDSVAKAVRRTGVQALHRRVVTTRSEAMRQTGDSVNPDSAGPLFGRLLILFGLWTGLAGGLAEVLVDRASRHLLPIVTSEDYYININQAWMAPVSASIVLCVLSLPWVFLARTRGPRAARFAPLVLLWLAIWGAVSCIRGLAWWTSPFLSLGLACQLAPWFRLERAGTRRVLAASAGLMIAAWLGLVVTDGILPATSEARALGGLPRAGSSSPNVVLIVMDTVRASSTSLHGYSRRTTPRLESWAARGAKFDQARSTAPWTLPSHVSMFTGRYPHETSAGLNRALDSACPTLAEELGGLGYATGGFVANFACCNAQYGVARGFARYHDAPGAWNRAVTPLELARSSRLGGWLMDRVFHVWKPEKEVYTTAEDARSINSRALDWIARQHHAGRPFFAFLNYMDAHGPYRIPADATRRFTVKDQDERIEAARRAVETRAGELAKVRLTHESAREYQELEAHFARVRTDAYDEAIGWIDSQIDSLLGELESRGLLENTVVIVTSDHGEMFGEHGGMTLHGHSLYRELTHVPLLILGAKAHPVPGGAAVSEVVSTRDIPATVLTLVGADTTAKRWPGRSLSRFWSDTQSAANLAAEPVYFEMEDLQRPKAQKNWPASSGPIWAVADSRHTYMRQLVWKGGEPGSLREELYRADDPAESRNLVNDPASGGELARLRPLLDHFILEIKRIESK